MPINTIHRVSRRLLCGATLGLCLATPVWASGTGAQAAPERRHVGEVTFIIGKAFVIHADGSRDAAKLGVAVGVGDRIETGADTQVHVRFVDNALVSVRRFSTLEVQRYDYREDDPAASVVKFNLVEGVARAVSGDAAKAARQNFRMNTPVAAIGVRGTDFVVGTDSREARAFVNQGAIVMAPFSTTCLAEAFGPCADNGLELAGGDQQIALVAANAAAPILVPANGNGTAESLLAGPIAIAQAEPAPQQPEEGSGNDLYTESVSTRVVTRKLTGSVPVQPKPPVVSQPGFTPDAPLPVAALADSQLAWGRYSESRASRELLSFPREIAREGRAITVGNDYYALYRVEQDPVRLKSGLAEVGFNLSQAVAYFTPTDGTESLMEVLGGRLTIDFAGGQFSTSLDMRHAATGTVNLVDQGRIFGGGYFHSRNPGQVVAGATSLDGTEAGYFFEKTLQNGLIEGITLWGSAP